MLLLLLGSAQCAHTNTYTQIQAERSATIGSEQSAVEPNAASTRACVEEELLAAAAESYVRTMCERAIPFL